ncbi:MAG TPA: hypothetical protein VF668_06660 [Pyrinomonadaceae bacterium]|jgi:hypothetical protein
MKCTRIIILISTLLSPHAAFPQRRVESIRAVDFANFTYPRVGEQRAYISRKTFTLEDGKYPEHEVEDGMHFLRVVYGDVTGDEAEEAIVVLGVQTRGSAIPSCVYIYTLRNKRPRLLWGFLTGDRAEGGLHNIYAGNGELVVELYGPKKRWEGYGQLMRFTRRRYVWRGEQFQQKGRMEVIPLPSQADINFEVRR